MKSYFFNAEATSDLQTHPTGYDREYSADDFAAYFAPFLTKAGVLGGEDPDACLVYVKEGTTLGVRPGVVYVKGRMAVLDGTETVSITGDCRLVARMNKTVEVRGFQLLAVAEPVRSDDIWDLELAGVSLTPVTGGYAVALEDTRTFLTSAVRPPNSSVPDAPALGRGMDTEDALAMVDAQDGRKLKLATPEELAAALTGFLAGAEHRHEAGDVDGGTFWGDFGFKGGTAEAPEDAVLKLLGSGKINPNFITRLMTMAQGRNLMMEAEDSGINLGISRVGIRLRVGTSVKGSIQAYTAQKGGEPTFYELYGSGNPPFIEGAYTGNGATERTVNLGTTPKVLFVCGHGAVGMTCLAVFFSLADSGGTRDGFMVADASGNTWSIAPNQAELSGSRLSVGGSINGNDARFFNVSGVTYYYFGLRAS